MGCAVEKWRPEKMFAAIDVPAEKSSVHPWMAGLLASNVPEAQRHLNERLACDHPELVPIIKMMEGYVPVQMVFSSSIGYLRCVRKYDDHATHKSEYDVLYVAQPLSSEVLESRVTYFDRDVQSLARELLKRFAGSGEQMEESSGQFTFKHWPSADAFNSREDNSFGDWRDAKLLYAAMNGDSVFIKPNGATAWHTLETDEITPIANTLGDFIETYADFRKTHEVFDSWNYRKYQSERAKR